MPAGVLQGALQNQGRSPPTAAGEGRHAPAAHALARCRVLRYSSSTHTVCSYTAGKNHCLHRTTGCVILQGTSQLPASHAP